MNKITLSIISILSIITVCLFFMFQNEHNNKIKIKNDLSKANIEITNLKNYNIQKENEIKTIQNAYNKVMTNYKGTECENMKVSVEMINALKTIRDSNE